jgi:hypothetical protein
MSKISVKYDETVQDAEKNVLEAKRDVFFSAYGHKPLVWTAVEDSKARRYLRVYAASDRQTCLGQFIIRDIEKADEELLKRDLMGGRFGYKDLP